MLKLIYNKFKKYYYFLVLFLGLLLDVLWVYAVPTEPISDFNYYNQLATQIANGGMWGDTRQAIGYPIVLALIYKLFGSSLWIAKFFNLFLSVTNSLLVLWILHKLNLKELNKKLVFTLFIFFPNNIFYNSILAKEILFTTVILLATSVYLSKSIYKYVYLGILVGIGTIIHASFIIYFFLIFLVRLVYSRKVKKSFLYSLIVLLVSFVVILPLVYRNSKLMGRVTYVSTNSGLVLYINNNSQNNSGMWMPAEDVENSVVKTEAFKKANRAERSKLFSTAAKKWIITHPKRFLELGFIRLRNVYFAAEDISWTFPSSNFSYAQKDMLSHISKVIRKIIFAPAIIYILFFSFKVVKDLIINKTYEKNIYYEFKLYSLVLFYMFSCTQFITEGQSRYFFPLIFIMIFFFVEFIKALLNYFGMQDKASDN